jgi:hypothetical protein
VNVDPHVLAHLVAIGETAIAIGLARPSSGRSVVKN